MFVFYNVYCTFEFSITNKNKIAYPNLSPFSILLFMRVYRIKNVLESKQYVSIKDFFNSRLRIPAGLQMP